MAGRLKNATIAFIASDAEEARQARQRLEARYGGVPPEEADAIVALGGDGFMLRTLHRFMNGGKPIYGMNCGSVGFLMNAYAEEDLPGRLRRAEAVNLHPLRMTATEIGRAHV